MHALQLLGALSLVVLRSLTVQVLLWGSTAALVLLHAISVESEAVTVVHGVGLILESRSTWGGISQVFYDQEDVADILIVEALTTVEVITHLALVLHSSKQLAVAYPGLRPRLQDLKSMYPKLHAQVVDGGNDT